MTRSGGNSSRRTSNSNDNNDNNSYSSSSSRPTRNASKGPPSYNDYEDGYASTSNSNPTSLNKQPNHQLYDNNEQQQDLHEQESNYANDNNLPIEDASNSYQPVHLDPNLIMNANGGNGNSNGNIKSLRFKPPVNPEEQEDLDAEGEEDDAEEEEEEVVQSGNRGGRKGKKVDDDEDEDDYDPNGDGDVDMNDSTKNNGSGRSVRNTRKAPKVQDDEEEESSDDNTTRAPAVIQTVSRNGRPVRRPVQYAGASSEEDYSDVKPKKTGGGGLRRGRPKSNFVIADEYDDEDSGYGDRRGSSRQQAQRAQQEQARKAQNSARRNHNNQVTKKSQPKTRNTRNSSKGDLDLSHAEEEDQSSSTDSDDDLDLHDEDDDHAPGTRKLREKAKIDYYNIPPIEALMSKGKGKVKAKNRSSDPFGGANNMTSAQWAALYPDKGAPIDSSDSDAPAFTSPRKATLFGSTAATAAAGFSGGGGMFAGGAMDNMASAGTPNNLGKVSSDATLADTDPLGVSSVSFDSVGGLGNHIQQLKEMVSLPLLYPEVFERFNITPPRGVLFHGPPGTGKTLLARALAASCSTEGRKISFFMRKGADCLSKWVGEAERQLRLLFDEAKACQPSIIFFDEIDGLAPVRSSKQDQVHASIVSTLLALMDGMDGRGQVIVIGATNRPDAIDPALRRPGRFDREFYFPLPNLEGRRKILDIHTSGWNPPIEEAFKDELAMLTKGYGGADLRALCTEAALNSVQRTYPQIYKTNDRLVIKPETIEVTARDFIVSQKNLIPSTARATSSSAAPIPPQLVPLLADTFELAKKALSKVLPEVKKPNVLEEAEWEDDGGGFEKEKMMQAFETLRVFRPRMLICGEAGMGQGYVGAAVLHHLEGFHVQTLDLATLVSDSSRTMEAACVQLFVEAKRHKPSILFIPSLLTWCLTVTDTVKSTIKGLLEGLDPSDPILLLAVVDGPLSDLPSDVRSWFGFVKGNRVVMTQPGADQRKAFFDEVMQGIQRPPNEFPDAMPRRKRILEVLPIAPPPPPKVPTAAEMQQLDQNDQRLLEYLKWKLGPILNELKKRYKCFIRSLYSDWRVDDFNFRQDQQQRGEEVVGLGTQPYHNVDLDVIHMDLYKGYYHTPDDFLADILRIHANAEINAILEEDAEAPIKGGQMVNHVKVMLDQTFDIAFKADCAKMAERMKERDKNLLPGERARGKGKGKEVISAAAKSAAAGGLGLLTRSRRSKAPGGLPFELSDIGEIERNLKRGRREENESQEEGSEGAGPSKRSKGMDVDEAEAEADANAEGEEAEAEGAESAVASTSRQTLDDPVINGNNALNVHNPSTSFNPFAHFNSAEQPQAFPLPPTLPTQATPLVPPMQVGALPDNINDMGITDNIPPHNLPALPDLSALAPPFASEASTTPAVHFSEEVLVAILPQNSRLSTPIPAEATEKALTPVASPIAIDPPTPEPFPDFVLPIGALDELTNFLTEETGHLTIDQLEQLRAACYDIIWRGRKDWDRFGMIEEITELVQGFCEEVASL